MATWKLSIKPAAQKGYDAFSLCRKKSLVGVGWSYIFENRKIDSLEESYKWLNKDEGRIPSAVSKLMTEVALGDCIWLHQDGDFYLCRITTNTPVLGPEISDEFMKFDLGHARHAYWVKVPRLLVSGRVQRCIIVSRTIQRIRSTHLEEEFFNYIHRELSKNRSWVPEIDHSHLLRELKSLGSSRLLNILSPDDWEDIVAAYLQSRGWTIVKSTCFRSNPEFEFLMAKPGPCYARVQVKTGNRRLDPSQYKKWVSENEQVFLFSTHHDPYSGEEQEGVHALDHKDLLAWLYRNTWGLNTGVIVQIQLYSDMLRTQSS